MFKIWKNRWEIFDDKFCKGFFMYTYNYNTYNKIEEYYSKYIKNEIDKYLENIESGLDTNCENSEIIMDLKKIKKMELIISLSKDIDGNEFTEIPQINEKETSKIQRILKSLNENFNGNNNNIDNELINKTLNEKNGNIIDKSENNNVSDETKTLNNNNEKSIHSINNNEEEYYDDIDGEPL